MPEGETTADDPTADAATAGMREPVAVQPPAVQLPAFVQMALVLLSRERFEAHLLRGPSVRTLKLPGLGKVIGISEPGDIKTLFTADPEVVRTGEIAARLLHPLGPRSIMLVDGERHMRLRRLLLPPFHGEAVKAYGKLIERIAITEIETWPDGEEFPAHPAMQRITLEAILRAVVGVSDRGRANRLRSLLPKVLQVNPFGFVAEGRFPRLGRGIPARLLPWVRARGEARELLREEIEAHRSAPEDHDDVLALLITARDGEGGGLSDDELEDQLLTLLLAGHETTASTLAFCFERLVRHPEVLARLGREVREGEGDTYLEAVIDETQRVRPVVGIAWRSLAAPLELGGYLLPAGTIVMPSISGLQASEVFEDADEFRPERFLQGRPDPYTLIPFGGGTRRCLGASFARLEVKIVLRAVLERFELVPTSRPAERRNHIRRISTIPARGARVTVRRRVSRVVSEARARRG